MAKAVASECDGLGVPRSGEVGENFKPQFWWDHEQLKGRNASTPRPFEALSSPINDLDQVVLHTGLERARALRLREGRGGS